MERSDTSGFVVILATLVVLSASLVIILSTSSICFDNIKEIRNNIYSVQAYYAAEAGIEDALLRLIDADMEVSNNYSLGVGTGNATIEIVDDVISGSKIITSSGDKSNRIRNVATAIIITTSEVSFHYGVQVGNGGLTMDSNSRVNGNVYSNGPVTGSSNATVYGDVYSASTTGRIDSLRVFKSSPSASDGNAHANTIANSTITNGAYYQNLIDSSAGSYFSDSPDPSAGTMPIPEAKIVEWKNTAAAGGEIGSYTLSSNQSGSLGPVKINGNLTVTSNATLTVTGTIWVTGNIDFSTNKKIKLHSSYGSLSDVIVADGKVVIASNSKISGSGSAGSYLMILSTNNSLNPASPAISATSNTDSAILYANQGMIVLSSNAYLKEVTAYALHLDSNAEVSYETGLQNVQFTSGPGASWELLDWKEIE